MTLIDPAVLAGLTPVKITETGSWRFAYLPLEDGTVKITDSRYISEEPPPDVFTLPESLDGLPVSALGRRTIGSCGFREVVIPACITTVEGNPFAFRPTWPETPVLERITVAKGHPTLQSVDGVLLDQAGTRLCCYPMGRSGPYALPEGTAAIGELAFAECRQLTAVTLTEGLISLGAEAFCNCRSLERITLPASLKDMGRSVFWSCLGLKEVQLPQNMTVLPEAAFRMCRGLERAVLPEGLRRICSHAFYGCVSLLEICLPEGLEELEDCVFTCCKALPSITLPRSLTAIGQRNFEQCPALTVTAPAGSPGEAFARDHGVPVRIIP